MSQYATKGEEITKLEERRRALEQENLSLNREIASARNLEYIKKEASNDGFVAITSKEVNYLTLKD